MQHHAQAHPLLKFKIPVLVFDTELNAKLISCYDPLNNAFFIFSSEELKPEVHLALRYPSLLPLNSSVLLEAFNYDPCCNTLKLHIFEGNKKGISEIEQFLRKSYLIGFNSFSAGSDDDLLRERGIKIKTTYDLLYEIRLALQMPPSYSQSLKHRFKSGYSLEAMSQANFELGKCNLSHSSVQRTWLAGNQVCVIRYAIRDVYLTWKLFENQKHLIDPNTRKPFSCRDLEEAIQISPECVWFAQA